MFAVFLVVFIDLLGFGIVLPLLPLFADNAIPRILVDGPEVKGILIGLLMSSFSAMQFLFSPFWGRLSDRIGRRPVLLIGLGGSVVFYTLFAVALSGVFGSDGWVTYTLLMISRIGAGIAGANIAAAQAVIADCTTPEKRAKGMALIGVAFGIGFTFGPLLAAGSLAFLPKNPGAIGYVAAGFSLLAFLLAFAKLPETRRPGVAAPVRSFKQLFRLGETLRAPGVGLLVLIFFLATLGFASLEGTLSLLADSFAYDKKQIALIFAFTGFSLMLAQGGLYRPLTKRISELKFMWIGLGLMFLGLGNLAAVAWAGESMTGTLMQAWFFAALGTGVCGFAFMTPSVQSLISRRSDPERQGEILGVNQSFAALARILGPLMGLTLFPLTESHLLPYLTAAVLLGVLLMLMPRIRGEGSAT